MSKSERVRLLEAIAVGASLYPVAPEVAEASPARPSVPPSLANGPAIEHQLAQASVLYDLLGEADHDAAVVELRRLIAADEGMEDIIVCLAPLEHIVTATLIVDEGGEHGYPKGAYGGSAEEDGE